MGGGSPTSERPERDQNVKDRDEIWHAVISLGENVVSIDELAQRKKCFFTL